MLPNLDLQREACIEECCINSIAFTQIEFELYMDDGIFNAIQLLQHMCSYISYLYTLPQP